MLHCHTVNIVVDLIIRTKKKTHISSKENKLLKIHETLDRDGNATALG